MKDQTYDVVIIGAGTAGLNARRTALQNGAKSVLLIEEGPYGTTCARIGCMPSKLLIHASNLVHEAKHGADVGIHAEVTVDGKAVLERLRRERDRFVGFVVEASENIPQEQRMKGSASFIDDHTLDIDGTQVHFKQVVIATGSHNNIPPVFQSLLEHAPQRVLTNENIFEIKDLPKSVAVFGMGVIGLELGQALSRLGVETKFFGRHRHFCGTSAPAVHDEILRTLGSELDLTLHSEVTKVEYDDDGVTVTWETDHNGKKETSHKKFEYVLIAAGRRPNVQKLHLERTSLTLNEWGLPSINLETGQAEQSHIFFAGDVTGERQLLHEAADEGKQAGKNAATYPSVESRVRRTRLMVTFTDPNIAVVGKSYEQIQQEGLDVATGQIDYSDQGRSHIMQKNKGILLIYACKKTRQIIGAEGIAPAFEHMAHSLAWIIQRGTTVDEALGLPFYHPVTEEGLRTALQDLKANLDKS